MLSGLTAAHARRPWPDGYFVLVGNCPHPKGRALSLRSLASRRRTIQTLDRSRSMWQADDAYELSRLVDTSSSDATIGFVPMVGTAVTEVGRYFALVHSLDVRARLT